jgi:hypothetical protein
MNQVFTTTLTPDECRDRVQRASEKERGFKNPFRKVRAPLVMKGTAGGFYIRKNNRVCNPLQPLLKCRLESMDRETRILLRFEVHPVNFWLLAFWYAYLFFLLFFTAPDPQQTGFNQTWKFIVTTAFFIALPTFLWALGAWWARGEKEFLLDALSEALNAGPVVWDDKRGEGGG